MSFQQLLDNYEKDPALAEAIRASVSIDGICAVALQHGIRVTPEEVIKGTAAITSELSDEDLAGVAGGSWTGNSGGDQVLSTAGGFAGAGIASTAIPTIIVLIK